MSNYTRRSSYWQGKDSLSDSDPEKIISGDDFDDEFELIETAVNTKANINGDSGEAFSTSTAAEASNTTIAASTQYVTRAISNINAAFVADLIYPVGSIYTSTSSTNPGTTFGTGTWEAFGEGKVLVGKASSGTFATAGSTGGSETHALTEAEMPKHYHDMYGPNLLNFVPQGETVGDNLGVSGNTYGGGTDDDGVWRYPTFSTGGDASSGSSGSGTSNGDAHNNLQPYIVVYMWKRTA